MITYLKGILVSKGETSTGSSFLVVEVNGIGYQVYTSTRSLLHLPAMHNPVTVYTSLIVREDAMQLVGFLTSEERELFEILETASGVGFKVALSLMSELSVSDMVSAIHGDQYKRLTAAKGVGPKLAQKITIELKDKISRWHEHALGSSFTEQISADFSETSLPAFQEAETVLLSLGYTSSEIYQALRSLQSTSDRSAEHLSSEEILQWVLKWLATHPIH